MANKDSISQTSKPRSSKEDRLKAALKENMARRKAQARARNGAKQAMSEQTNTSAKGAD